MTPSAIMEQCAILAGGLATRLGSIAQEVPKPVLDVAGRPFLAWLMRELQRYGVEEFVILTGHLAGPVRDAVEHAADALPKRARLVFSEEKEPAGTAGALRQAGGLLAERFLLCNGDSLFDANLALLLRDFAADDRTTLARLMLRDLPDATRYGVVATEGDRVIEFRERPADVPGETQSRAGTINTGIYALRRQVLDHCPQTGSLERDVLPRLAAAGQVRGTTAAGFFVDIGVQADLERARHDLRAVLRRPALFLDRDGVLNHDHGYVGTRDRWQWTAGALEGIKLATDHGWHVFVVTNQSGVARGLYTEPDVKALMGWVADEACRHGGTLDDWRYCPYHPEAPLPEYRRESLWRKPNPGMVNSLIAGWELDPGHCLLVGDQSLDMEAARNAGIRGALFPGGNLAAFLEPLLLSPTP
jgi:D,D-heptose 1,7-bisphosphate phosphatase